jgi:quercetin dioxygenase-like cupin family protein
LEIIPRTPATTGASGWFTGEVWSDLVISSGDDPSRLRAQNVRFTPGARTAWHRHGTGQALFITDGTALVQAGGGRVVTVPTGGVVYIAPHEWHWHGATPDNFMVHLAVLEGTGDPADAGSELGELVSEEEYTAANSFGPTD